MYPVLGIDFGKTHIGLALATGPLVEPLPEVLSSKIFSVLPRIIFQYSILTLVVGIPDGPIKKDVQLFVQQLQKSLPNPQPKIVFYDETLSTFDAVKSLLHTTKKRRRKLEHSAAAAIILQSWLDSLMASSVKST